MAQVTRKGEKPVASPAIEAELRRRKNASARVPHDDDAPPLTTFPGPKPHIHEGQLAIGDSGDRIAARRVSAPGAA